MALPPFFRAIGAEPQRQRGQASHVNLMARNWGGRIHVYL
jgi:hypothetical protein